jgi:hypothetical protein
VSAPRPRTVTIPFLVIVHFDKAAPRARAHLGHAYFDSIKPKSRTLRYPLCVQTLVMRPWPESPA